MRRRVALITGASRGIGAATAPVLAERGFRVVINHRASAPQAEEVVASIRAAGGEAVAEELGGGGVDDFRYNVVVNEEIHLAGCNGVGLGVALHNDIVLPYFLAVASVLPTGAANGCCESPPPAFAIQQTVIQYPQVAATYRPGNGYFPLAPWAGFAVLCGYAALVFALAVITLRRKDA